MITTYVGRDFDAVVTGAPHGLVGTITFSIVNAATEQVVVAPRTTGITEPTLGVYWTTAAAPSTPDEYLVVWASGGTDAVEELTVLANPAVRPTVQQVALLLRTRTVGPSSGGLGGDTGPADVTTFTSTTRPTAAEVEAMIDLAMSLVVGPLGGESQIPPGRIASVQTAIAAWTAMLIEESFFREQVNADSRAWWQNLIDQGLSGLIDEEGEVSTNYGFGSIPVTTDRAMPSDPVDAILDFDYPAG